MTRGGGRCLATTNDGATLDVFEQRERYAQSLGPFLKEKEWKRIHLRREWGKKAQIMETTVPAGPEKRESHHGKNSPGSWSTGSSKELRECHEG